MKKVKTEKIEKPRIIKVVLTEQNYSWGKGYQWRYAGEPLFDDEKVIQTDEMDINLALDIIKKENESDKVIFVNTKGKEFSYPFKDYSGAPGIAKLNAYGANYSLTDLAQEVNIEKEFIWYNKEYYDEFVRTKLLEGLEDKKDDK